jgi:DNA-binding transcriptional MerR regulator
VSTLEPKPLELPDKRYFSIGEVSELCGVKPHVLRYWEQEFSQLKPLKRLGNRRYYQHHEVQMVRRIRDLLYGEGFTIVGARSKLQELLQAEREQARSNSTPSTARTAIATALNDFGASPDEGAASTDPLELIHQAELCAIQQELREIRALLKTS